MAKLPKCDRKRCQKEAEVEVSWQTRTGRSGSLNLCWDHAGKRQWNYPIVGKAILRPVSEEAMREAMQACFRLPVGE